MSLVIGFSGASGAVIGGDMREVLLWGEEAQVMKLERALYSGEIRDDAELTARAADLGVNLSIRDGKVKIREEEGVLIGEVSESDGGVVRKRRLYITPGEYAIADIRDRQFDLRTRESRSSFVVLGNEVTKRIANEAIREEWKNGTFEDAIHVIITALDTAAFRTASVSKNHLILQTRMKSSLSAVIGRDREETEGTGSSAASVHH
jgi:hypothetical protein